MYAHPRDIHCRMEFAKYPVGQCLPFTMKEDGGIESKHAIFLPEKVSGEPQRMADRFKC